MNNVMNIADRADMPRVFSVDENGNSQPVEQTHPANINYTDFDDNPALKRASDCLKFTWEGLASIDNMRANPNPEDTPARHARRVREAEANFSQAHCERWDGAKAGLEADARRVDGELEKAANLKPNEKHFNAIVGSFQAMNPGLKAQTLDQLIAEGDGPTLATLIEAPLFVTGLTADQRDNIKLRLFSKVNPKGLALRNQLEKAANKMEAASLATINACMALLHGTDRFDKRVREAEELASKARTGFAA